MLICRRFVLWGFSSGYINSSHCFFITANLQELSVISTDTRLIGQKVASRSGYFISLKIVSLSECFLVFLFCVTMMEILAASKGREYHAIYVNA